MGTDRVDETEADAGEALPPADLLDDIVVAIDHYDLLALDDESQIAKTVADFNSCRVPDVLRAIVSQHVPGFTARRVLPHMIRLLHHALRNEPDHEDRHFWSEWVTALEHQPDDFTLLRMLRGSVRQTISFIKINDDAEPFQSLQGVSDNA